MFEGITPPSWLEAIVIPIPKAGKDHTDPNNYHPIALTSCIYKTMEKMVNKRLVCKLESDYQISNLQCVFRRGRGTLLDWSHTSGTILSKRNL